ncbi:MAG: peptidylprolyl isomerase [Oscillospiraceae bacterium]|nr:peptidylprolyl isomerase [Oscillospiraceae bacterium]
MSASTKKKQRIAAREAGTDKKILAAQKEAELKAQSKRRWTLGAIGVILLVAIILFLNSGFLYKNTAALSIGDTDYSPAQVNYQYANQFFNLANQYGSYAAMMGLDTSNGISGLDEQACPMLEDGTWKDYFMDATMTAMTQMKAVEDYAKAEGISLSEEDLAALDAEFAELDEAVKAQGYSNVNNFFGTNYGNGVNAKLAREASELSTLVNKTVLGFTEALDYTAEELAAQYESYEGEQDYYEYSYYYIAAETVEGEDGSLAATDETKAEAEKTANAILAAYNELEDEDIEARLNAAIAEAGVDADCISTRSSGESLGTYKDWIMSLPEAGEATVLSNDAGSGFYVVAFRAHDANEYNVANVRHILVQAVADENGVYTDDAKAEAKARAEELYNEWKSGEATEDSFAAMANEYSEDGGSNTRGGLYENVMRGQMVEEFDAFCFEGHKAGDTAIVYGESLSYAGYHIMYFVGEGENCRDYIARADLSTTDTQAWIDELVAGYEPVEKFWLKLAA